MPRTVEANPAADVADRLPVTDPPSWLALLGLSLVTAAGLLWAVFGHAPDGIGGDAIVVPATGFREVGSMVEGTVTALYASPGQAVALDALLAHVVTDAGDEIDVTSPVAGTVVAVLVRPGVVTTRGTALLTIQPSDTRLVVVGFVPAGPGKQVAVGMEAQVGLASVPSSAWGMLVGRVSSVAAVPASEERVALVVGGDHELAAYFLGGGPVLEVTVELVPEPANPSGYRWTAGTGPATTVTTGSLGTLTVLTGSATR